ncbi:MAG: hypothetical protein SOR57_05920 [Parabacteroides sp.]|nr:hypothetical protein [Parabacteroides sp.]
MKTPITLQKHPVLLFVALLAGVLLMTGRFCDFYEHILSKGISTNNYSCGLLLGQSVYFVLLAWLLLQVNINRRTHKLKQLFISVLITVFFSAAAYFAVPTFQNEANVRIVSGMKACNEGQNLKYADKLGNLKGECYNFHESSKVWVCESVVLLVVIYSLSQIFLVSAKKE